jgi:hypothetical protein
MVFSPDEVRLIKQSGRSPEQVLKQVHYFSTGFPYIKLLRPAKITDGILSLNNDEIEVFLEKYASDGKRHSIVKFVPASGAATRMFKDLYRYLLEDFDEVPPTIESFFASIQNYPFFEKLEELLQRNGYILKEEIQKRNYKLILEYLLTEKGLNFGNLPKALLPFHRYPNQVRTAFEEHLVEAAYYAQQGDKRCQLHFTVSPQHLENFKKLMNEVLPYYEKRYSVKYDITFSVQDAATDTIAAEMDNTLFHDGQGQLLFRPGGHGALIYNLNKLQYDIVFIKNIDNLLNENNIELLVKTKKILAGYLIYIKEKIDNYLQLLEKKELKSQNLKEILHFAENVLNIKGINEHNVFEKLNRPVRVCGMVKNEGEPGGGPFWVQSKNGDVSLQIVESSQIDLKNEEQRKVFDDSTHFNPVDIVCSFKDFRGNYFSLPDFIDPETGFISIKSFEGKSIKTMELPGLWNGSMADWITVFIEVPLATFSPVKTIFDLFGK